MFRICMWYYTQISKSYVDSYQPGKWIPCCQLWACFAASDLHILRVRRIAVRGAKWLYNTFIIRSPTPHGLGMCTCTYIIHVKWIVFKIVFLNNSQLHTNRQEKFKHKIAPIGQ